MSITLGTLHFRHFSSLNIASDFVFYPYFLIGLWLTRKEIPGLLKLKGFLPRYCLSPKDAKVNVSTVGRAVSCRMPALFSSTNRMANLTVLFTQFDP